MARKHDGEPDDDKDPKKPKGDEVPIDPPEKDDDDEAEAKPTETPEERESRRERRRERGRLYKEAQELRERLERQEREFADHRSRTDREMQILRMERAVAQAPKREEEDPVAKELDGVFAEEDALLARWGALTPEQQAANREEYVSKMRAIERKKGVAYAKAAIPKQQQAPQMDERTVHQTILRGKYPKVYGDQRALAYAHSIYNAKVARGAVDSMDLADEVMRETMAEFGLGDPPDVSDAERRRHVSTPRGGRMGAAPKPRTIVMTKEYKEMANAAYPHIKDEKQRHAKWAQEVGPEILEAD